MRLHGVASSIIVGADVRVVEVAHTAPAGALGLAHTALERSRRLPVVGGWCGWCGVHPTHPLESRHSPSPKSEVKSRCYA